MTIIFDHRWPMRSKLQQSNVLDALFKSTTQYIFWKCDLNLPNMCFRLSMWPNGHRESQLYEFVKWLPITNEATGIIALSPNSALMNTQFPFAFSRYLIGACHELPWVACRVVRHLALYLPRLAVLVSIEADRPGAWFPGRLSPYAAFFPAI